MIEVCEFEVPRQKLLECPPCSEIFFTRISQVRIGPFIVVIIKRYVVRKCFLGLALGQHVHSLTLLPKEEIEIEIVRRSKFSRALHEQRSVESEFRSEMTSTARDEWSREEESNFKVTGDEGFKIFGIGVKSTQEYSLREKVAEQHFREIVTKTSRRVSQKYEIAVDTKTEVENQYRSVRKIANPNACQPVIYNYFQLAKKYKTELILVDIRFDILRQTPPVLVRPLTAVLFEAESPYRQNLNLQVVAPPPPWTLTAQPVAAAFAPLSPTVTRFAAFQPATTQPFAGLNIAALPGVEAPVEPPDVMELTEEEVIEKARAVSPNDVDKFRKPFSDFLKDPGNKTGVRDTYEYCINTDGVYVEANLSKCSACDETTLKLQELEVEKLKAEIELMKRKPKSGEEG